MGGQGVGGRGGPRHGGNPHVERNAHDLVVDEGTLGPQPVGSAHVAVVGREDHDGVVPGTAVVKGLEDRSEALVGEPVELDVVVEVTEPGLRVRGVDVPPETVLLVPAPLAVGLRLGMEVVREIGREFFEYLVIGTVVDGEGVVLLPSRALEDPADAGHLLGVALGVAGLVDGEPHDVVRVDQRHRQEPGLVVGSSGRRRGSGIGPQPVGGVGGDDGVEVDAGPGPTHEVAVVSLPVGESVALHVGMDGLRQVPFADVGASGSPRRAAASRSSGPMDRARRARA